MTDFFKYIVGPISENMDKFSRRDAFCLSGERYSYAQLKEVVSHIRAILRGIDSQKVGLVVNDDFATYASILALWFEGKCYVPLHPNQPLDRCMEIINQVGLKEIVDSSVQTRYKSSNIIDPSFKEGDKVVPFGEITEYPDTNLAYILLTSGSTGKPKGVMITRGNVGSFMDSFWKTGIKIDENDRCLQCFDLTFDVSVQSFLSGLTVGACVYTVQPGNIKYIVVASMIEDEKITFGAMAPSMLRYLKPYFEELDFSTLKTVILTAEASPLALVEEWLKQAGHIQVYDFYGPTEATIYCTYYKLRGEGENKTLNGMLSIGKPMANVEAIIVDDNFNEVERGVKGELCLSGGQITAGYWENPERDKSAFIFKEVAGKSRRFYRTGDLCFVDDEGDIMYSGRIDNQAKIQGFRVELGEIEFHARAFLSNINVVAMAFDNEASLTQLALFVESDQFDTNPLEEYLRGKMPSYMVPSKYIFVPLFPLNSSDKIDRIKLKAILD